MAHIELRNYPGIEFVPTDELKPNKRSARRHSDKKIQLLANSIQRFGLGSAIIVDDDNDILAGNACWRALKKLGWDEVPIMRMRLLTEASKRAFILASNRLAELAEWDEDLLAEELQFLFDDGYDIDITGFTLADLDFSIGSDHSSGEQEAVELPDPNAEAISQIGDLWLIGPHKIYCGNSLDASSYEILLGDERAAMVFSDPPYNVPIDGHVSGLGKIQHREFAYASGEMSKSEFTMFLRTSFRHCVNFSVSGSIHYHCIDWKHLREMLDAADGVYTEQKQLLVWNKSNAGMGTTYRSKHELIPVFKSGRGKHINNFGLGETGRYRTNVLDYPGANTFRKGRNQDLADHPTVKPIALVIDLLLDCSNRGDLILDPFSGSATTLCATHKTGRRGAAIEIDPTYVDTGIRRLCQLSGLTAVHADGRRFDEVAAERLGAQEAADVEA